MDKKAPSRQDPVAKKIAENIRKERKKEKMSMQRMAEHLGITYQQVQKYEKTENHVNASRLYSIAKILNTNIESLYKDVETPETTTETENE